MKTGFAAALALAMAASLATAHAEEGTSDGMPGGTPAVFDHLPGADDSASPAAVNGTSGSSGYLFVAASAFTPRNSATSVNYIGAGCIAAPDYVVSDVQLPEGVSVLGVRAYYYNNGLPGGLTTSFTSYDGAGAATDHLFTTTTLNSGYANEYLALPTAETIANADRAYVLQASTPTNMRFCGMRVFFQYP